MLMLHPPFAVPNAMVVDVLHFLFLGIVLMLLNYWFGKQHKNKAYSLYSKVSMC